jgi:DNA-binding transcriptional regulator YhcF (GntR family)
MEILKDLFDEKIISIVMLFVENPEKKFFLTDIANQTKVNLTTTFRILQKLSEKGFIKTTALGKARFYQLEKNEKTHALSQFIKKDSSDPVQKFIDNISEHPRVKKIILDSKKNDSAKLIIIGDFLPQEKLNKACDEVKSLYKFKISYVEISENQYEKLKNFENYNLEKKIIWKRKEG